MNMKKVHVTPLLAMTLILAGALGWLLGAGPDASASTKKVLNVALYQDIGSFDPHAGILPDWLAILGNLYEGLIDNNDALTGITAVLATRWEASRDGLTHTVHLRKGAKFSDGTPFNAAAVKVNFDRVRALKKASATYLRSVESVSTPADDRVVFRLSKIDNTFVPGLRFFMIVSPTAVKQHEKAGDWAQDWLRENSVGTGPYMTKSWQRGVNIQWVKNPHYRAGWKENQFEEVNLRMIYEAETQRVMIEKGDLDIAQNISLDTLPALRRARDLMIHENVGTARNFIVMNAAAGPTRDVRVRKAISHLWNHDTYAALRQGLAPRSDGPSPAIVMGADYRPNLVYRYDPERARKLLAEAGYAQGGLTLTFLLQKGDEPKRTQFEVLQSELAKVGIRMTLIEETWPAINKRLADWGTGKDPATAVHFVGYWRVVATFTPADYLFWMYDSEATINKGGRNLLYYANPEVDRLIDAAISAANKDEELKLWRKVNELVFDDAPALFVEKLTDWVVTRADLGGYLYRGDRLNNLYYRMFRK